MFYVKNADGLEKAPKNLANRKKILLQEIPLSKSFKF